MSMYAYDFQTSGFAIIDDVRAIIDSQPEWDHSNTETTAMANCAAAAKRFGYTRLTTDEQKALADYLINAKAGLHIATYAWGTYSDLKAHAEPEASPAAALVPA